MWCYDKQSFVESKEYDTVDMTMLNNDGTIVKYQEVLIPYTLKPN